MTAGLRGRRPLSFDLWWAVAMTWRCLRDPLAISRLVRLRALAFQRELARGLMVDVGAGTHPFADLFEGQVDRIIAVEWPGGSPKTGVGLWGDAQALPLQTGAADTVLCVEVLEYLPDPRRALQEFARILRRGGRLILTAPQIRGASNEPNDYWRFGHPGLRLLAAEAGLDEIVITPCGGICAAYGQRLSSWLYHSLIEGLGLPRWLVRIVCGFILAVSWLADQAGIGREETLHWLLTARRP